MKIIPDYTLQKRTNIDESSSEKLIKRLLNGYCHEYYGDIDCTDLQIRQLKDYIHEMLLWSKNINITGITGIKEAILKHIGDTLTLLPYIPHKKHLRLADIGSGAGIPGIILKILMPEIDITLIDARRKKVSFLHYIIARLGLKGITAVHQRLSTNNNGVLRQFNIVVSRAVGDINLMTRLSIPLLSPDGMFILMKGPAYIKEIEETEAKDKPNILGSVYNVNNELKIDNIKKISIIETSLPITNDKRVLIIGSI